MIPESCQTALHQAADLLRAARHAVVFTGAGISTPSGIPDFRSQNTGLWQRFNPMEVASLTTFRAKPERFYDWLRPLLREIWRAQPNPAHIALAQLEAAGRIKAVITQNIDAFHQQAGSKTVLEVHGSLRTMTCLHCKTTHRSEAFKDALTNAEVMPHCPECDCVMKPDITLFEEMLPMNIWAAAEAHCRAADLVLVVGSSLEVYPAASLPQIAVENGASLIINNLSATPLDPLADVLLPIDVAAALPHLVRLLT